MNGGGSEVGCLKVGSATKDCWVRVMGLGLPYLLHLWRLEILRKIGESYGGFIRAKNFTLCVVHPFWG